MPGGRLRDNPHLRDPAGRRDRFGRLLAVLVFVFIESGFGSGPVARLVASLTYLGAIALTVGATGLPARLPQTPVAIALTVLAVASLVLNQQSSMTLHAYGSLCTAVVIAGLLLAVLARVLTHDDVQFQTIAGALCAYLLFGFFFASLYSALDVLGPNHFLNQSKGTTDYLYFSYVTLTTVGFGDIVPVSTLARRLVVLEGITGQVFLATAVARLVSVARLHKRGEVDPTEGDELSPEPT